MPARAWYGEPRLLSTDVHSKGIRQTLIEPVGYLAANILMLSARSVLEPRARAGIGEWGGLLQLGWLSLRRGRALRRDFCMVSVHGAGVYPTVLTAVTGRNHRTGTVTESARREPPIFASLPGQSALETNIFQLGVPLYHFRHLVAYSGRSPDRPWLS